MTSKTEPNFTASPEEGSGDFQSRKINAPLIGRMSRMCVYWSSPKARAKEDVSGTHQITREIAPRMKKTASEDNLKADSRFGALGTMYSNPLGRARLRPLRKAVNDYFVLTGSRQRGGEIREAEGSVCFGIAAGASFEMILGTPLSLIALTT